MAGGKTEVLLCNRYATLEMVVDSSKCLQERTKKVDV
jgi:hypothetical protein